MEDVLKVQINAKNGGNKAISNICDKTGDATKLHKILERFETSS
jgi:hypothetical protein